VTEILGSLNLDTETLAAAILHDVVEDTDVTLEDIQAEYGPEISRMVDGVTKMEKIGEFQQVGLTGDRNHHQAESLRKLLLAMAEDVRVVLIKLADRLHNMRTLQHLDPERQRRIARETLDIYAPLANRLGIWQIKWELETSARILERAYHRIASLLDEAQGSRSYIEDVRRLQGRCWRRMVRNAEISGRPCIASIVNKMRRKRLSFEQLYDIRAVRVLVKHEIDCYTVLGLVHNLWQPIPGEFDDYISQPKSNDYRSLHTAVIGRKRRRSSADSHL
jgi:GTP pyrophosphokinase